jgi:hypothetical protein
MIGFKFLGAAVILSAVIATPVLAEPAIQEPGAFAFYHPNGDLGIGSTRRSADAMASARVRVKPMSHPVVVRRSQVAKSY